MRSPRTGAWVPFHQALRKFLSDRAVHQSPKCYSRHVRTYDCDSKDKNALNHSCSSRGWACWQDTSWGKFVRVTKGWRRTAPAQTHTYCAIMPGKGSLAICSVRHGRCHVRSCDLARIDGSDCRHSLGDRDTLQGEHRDIDGCEHKRRTSLRTVSNRSESREIISGIVRKQYLRYALASYTPANSFLECPGCGETRGWHRSQLSGLRRRR